MSLISSDLIWPHFFWTESTANQLSLLWLWPVRTDFKTYRYFMLMRKGLVRRNEWYECAFNYPKFYVSGLPSMLWRCWLGIRKGIISYFIKIQNGLPFLCRLTGVVLKRPLSVCTTAHSFNGLFSRTTWVSRHQKSRTILVKPTWIYWSNR